MGTKVEIKNLINTGASYSTNEAFSDYSLVNSNTVKMLEEVSNGIGKEIQRSAGTSYSKNRDNEVEILGERIRN